MVELGFTVSERFQQTEKARPVGHTLTHLVADGAVVLHRVLDAAVLVAQGGRVARSCAIYNRIQTDGSTRISVQS